MDSSFVGRKDCRPRRSRTADLMRWWPAGLAGAGMIALLYGRLLVPGALLAFRDLPFFHLPLRTTLSQMVAAGEMPLWNPLLNGGQPILSNPNYAAFYPPTWLSLLVGPAFSLSLGIVLHAALGCAGAIYLIRRCGGSPAAGVLAAVGWAGCGAVVSIASTYTLFSAVAWWPWILAWGIALVESERWARPAVLVGLGLALQLLAGEPVAVLLSALPLTALAVARPWRRIPWGRLATAALLAVLLGAVQLVPAWNRVKVTERTSAAFTAESLGWSAPPQRFLEMGLPRLFGDPMRLEEDLYFGWTVHDRSFPYIPSVYPGLLLLVVGIVALLRRGIPHRAGWALAIGVAVLLALGRHNPLLLILWGHLPVLGWIRFPEKFLVAVVLGLVMVGVLGWHRLLTACREGARRVVDLPLALASGFLLLCAGIAGVLHLSPTLSRSFAIHYGPPVPVSEERLLAGIRFLQQQSLVAVVLAAGVMGLLAMLRWSQPPPWLPAALAPLLLALDLSYYGHSFVRVGAVENFLQPPPALAGVVGQPGRVFTDVDLHRGQEIRFRSDAEAGFQQIRLRADRGDPYLGNLWGLCYVGNTDYDRMLTPWARHSRKTLEAEWWRDRELAYRFLGSWGVATMLLRRTPEEWIQARRQDPAAPPMRVEKDPYDLPLVRSVPVVEFHSTLSGALEAARQNEYTFPWQDYFVAPQVGDAVPAVAGAGPQFLRFAQRSSSVTLHSRAEGDLLIVVAMTFDPGWRAVVIGSDATPIGQTVPLFPTAAGQIGLRLPAGEHQVLLRYHQPGLLPGSLLSLLGFAVAAILWVRGR